jgi:hypothetical protein
MPLDNLAHETLFRKCDKEKVVKALNGVFNAEPQDYSTFNAYELRLMEELVEKRIKAFEDKINLLIKEFGYIP